MKWKLVFVILSILLILAVAFQPPPAGHSAEWPDEYFKVEGGKSITLGVGVKTTMVASYPDVIIMETQNGMGHPAQEMIYAGECKTITTIPIYSNGPKEPMTEPAHAVEVCNPWLGHAGYKIIE